MGWLKIVNKADKEVEITIEGIIGGSFFVEGVTMEQVNRDLKNLKAIEADTVTVNMINVPGGSVLHGLGIIDILENLGVRIKVKAIGMIASMGAEIAMVAKKEDREATKNTWVLIHRLTGNAGGTITEVEAAIKFWKKNEQKLIDLVVEGSDLDAAAVEELMDRDGGKGEFLTAEEARDMGLIGKITGDEPVSMAAFTDKEIPDSGLPTLPANLVKVPKAEKIDTDGIVSKIFAKLTEYFDKPENKDKMDETAITALIKSEVDTIKAEYDPKLENLNASEIKAGIAEGEVTRLKKELQGHADGTDNDADKDPSLKGKSEFTMGAEILAKMSPSMRTQLNKKAKAIADAEAALEAAKK